MTSPSTESRRVRFDALATLVNDRVDNPAESGVERYVGLEHLEADSLRIRQWGEITDVESTKLRFRPGDIIFGKRRAYQRKLAVADFEGICSAHAMVLRAKPEAVHPQFLPYFMQSDMFMERALAISVGSLSPTINWRDLAQQQFTLPPIEEQRRMALAMSAADATSSHLLRALELVGDAYESWSEREIENHRWPCRSAIELLTRATVGIVVKPAELYVAAGTGVRALRSLNVLRNRIAWNDCVEISPAGHALHQKSALRPGDVVVVRSGRPGDAAVVPGGTGPLNAVDLIVATPGPAIRAEYLCRFLNSVGGRRQFASGTAGTAQLHFNVELFKRLQVPVPPLAEQDRIASTAQHFDEAVASIRQRMDAVRAIRGLLTGRLSSQ